MGTSVRFWEKPGNTQKSNKRIVRKNQNVFKSSRKEVFPESFKISTLHSEIF